ncbi:unnamed protein product [Taenia asiatica]|uniref:Non-specific serine/threonine protein kinase n=1 Tax=Taenia asiatica TaxID=60517 RepID=A0A0R3WC74_TAEAS|nr:unnamed protein product [Taenia asiatica]
MGIDDSADMSDEAWMYFIILTEDCLSLSPAICFNKTFNGDSSRACAVRASYFSKILPGFSQALFAAVVALDTGTLDKIQLKDYSSFVENSITPLGKLLKLSSTSVLFEPIAYSSSAKDRLFSALSDFSSGILCGCWRFLNLNMETQSLRDHLLSSLIIVNADESCSSFKKSTEVLSTISKRDFPMLTSQEISGLKFTTNLDQKGLVLSRKFVENLQLHKLTPLLVILLAFVSSALLGGLSDRNLLQLTSETEQTAITQWPPSDQPTIGATPTSTTRDQKIQCLKACVFMELLATASKIWDSSVEEGATYPDEMQTFILQMFSLATGTGLVASTAQRALSSISRNCGYCRFEEFTCAASEPILSSLAIDFHSVLLSVPSDNSTFSTSPLFMKLDTTCRALSYLVDNTTFEAIQRVQPAVMQMLICMDLSYEFAASVFLPVLRKVIGFCLRPPPTDDGSSGDDRHVPSLCSSSTNESESSFIEKLQNRRNDKVVISSCMKKALEMTSALVKLTRKQHSYAFAESYSHTDQSVTPSTSADGQKALDAQHDQSITRPTQIRLAEEIMLRTIHMMSSSDSRLKVMAMSLLCDGCSRLTDEDVLLPLVHKTWSPLLARMQDRNPAVVEKAFELFATLTYVAGTFIRSRATTDLIGCLVTFLERGASFSAGATSSFECLTVCRVQKKLLYAIGPICVQVCFCFNHWELILCYNFRIALKESSQIFHHISNTDRDQPPTLREAAACSLCKLYDLDPGVVAYELYEHGFLNH